MVAGRQIAGELFHVSGRDPWVAAGTAATVAAVAVITCRLPEWRASRVDPMVALRAE